MSASEIYCPRCGHCGRKQLRLFSDGFYGFAWRVSSAFACFALSCVVLALSVIFWPIAVLAIVPGAAAYVIVEAAVSSCCRQCGYPAVIALDEHRRKLKSEHYVPPHKLNRPNVVRNGGVTKWT